MKRHRNQWPRRGSIRNILDGGIRAWIISVQWILFHRPMPFTSIQQSSIPAWKIADLVRSFMTIASLLWPSVRIAPWIPLWSIQHWPICRLATSSPSRTQITVILNSIRSSAMPKRCNTTLFIEFIHFSRYYDFSFNWLCVVCHETKSLSRITSSLNLWICFRFEVNQLLMMTDLMKNFRN